MTTPTAETPAPHSQLAELSPAQPNIVLISLDTVRADHLGCYGYKQPTTPNLDRLAAQGIRFDACRTPATWTLPAHMSLLTSLLPSQHGVDNLNKVLPRSVLTLTEALQQAGYQTAALVNNGQMQAHWGFDRGFDHWQEFEVDTPAGAAKNITNEAIAWLERAPHGKPHFLFLHYYDAHDPYESAAEFRERFDVTLTGEQCRELCFAHRSPEQPAPSQTVLTQLQAAYDAGLAELDHEVSRLLSVIDPDTLVVVCSDHGEAFREHAWLLHGATLYDEEVRVPLVVRLPQSKQAGTVVAQSTTLLDVAPTLLSLAGLPLPQQFQGVDLRPTMLGAVLPPRCVLAESKGVLEGVYTRSAVVSPYKLIWSLADGSSRLFKLPDEQDNIVEVEPQMAATLQMRLEAWLAEESFWRLYASGDEAMEVRVMLSSGRFGLFIPLGFDPEHDSLEVSPAGNELIWRVAPTGARQQKSLWLEPADPAASLRLHVESDGKPAPQLVTLGPEGELASALPVELAADFPAIEPRLAPSFASPRSGLRVLRFQSADTPARGAEVAPLDAETIRQLRSLGYLK